MTDQAISDALLNFRSRETEVLLRPDPFHLREVVASLKETAATRHLAPTFVARVKQTLVDGIYRLDAVPRDDRFWDETNRRPTIGKLRDFGVHLLRSASDDVEALWLLAAMDVYWYSNDFGSRYWREMHRLRVLDASWPVNAAYHLHFSSGPCTAAMLAHFLKELGLKHAAHAELQRLCECGDDSVRTWAQAVMKA